MFSKEIQELLQKSLQPLPAIMAGQSLRHDMDDLVAMAFTGKRLAIVDDLRTSGVLGDDVFRALRGRFDCTHITLHNNPHADRETVDYVRGHSTSADALVAVGSGTISDICKYTSHLDHKPYVVFPTAASMNGYLSANASIKVEGYKQTLPAHMPLAVFCDLSIIAAAPPRLSKSGLGDSLARPTAQADWLLSHLLLGTRYNATPFDLLKPLEDHLFENARGLAMGDSQSIELLMQTLLLSGLGMSIAGGSYPASQGEHMIAHAYGMLPAPAEEAIPTLHGEDIGVTALAMARRQEMLLRDTPLMPSSPFDANAIAALWDEHTAAEAKKSYDTKQQRIAQAHLNSDTLAMQWQHVASRIEPITISSERIEAILNAAQAPPTPEALGWNTNRYFNASLHARFLRDRFTFLDIT
jgi:glycerol-1-phosphate dehydrogenase [NAD(P)+]